MDWLNDFLRDDNWNGIIGIITLVGILIAIVNDPGKAAQSAKNLLNGGNVLLKTIVNGLKDLLRGPIDFVWAYGWDIIIVWIIYAIVQGQEGIAPEVTKLLGLLFSAGWVFVRVVIALQKENRELRARVDNLNNWATQLTEWINKREVEIDHKDLAEGNDSKIDVVPEILTSHALVEERSESLGSESE